MTKVITVTGGKGGVGKSNISVNLSAGLAKLGKKVILLDADLGLTNVELLLGLHSKRNLSDVMNNRCDLKDILIKGPHGVMVAPAASGIQSMVELSNKHIAGLIHTFDSLQEDIDFLIIDTAAGISNSVTQFVSAAHENIIVTCNEPASLTDAYALIKVLHQNHRLNRFKVLVNMTTNNQEGRNVFLKLEKVCNQFLDVYLQYIGSIPYDEQMKKSVQNRKPVIDNYPQSKSATALTTLAARISEWPVQNTLRGGVEFFAEQLAQG